MRKNRLQLQEWFEVHPLKDEILQNPHLHIPLRLYGDEVALNFNGKKMMVITISPARCRLPSWDCKWLYCVLPMERIIPRATFKPICQLIGWVFKVLGSGRQPVADHRLRRWGEGSHRHKVAGSLIARAYKGAHHKRAKLKLKQCFCLLCVSNCESPFLILKLQTRL